ncbi:MAG: hypothetical protein ACOC1K_03980 [Nanoarchaeota archaeon]
MRQSWISLFFWVMIFVVISSFSVSAYSPLISGSFKNEQKTYTEFIPEQETKIVDIYNSRDLWLKYKKQWAVGEYYYIRGQVSDSVYQKQDTYNNSNLNLSGNFTFYLTDDLRNRIKVKFGNKNYYDDRDKSRVGFDLSYQLDYEFSDIHDYSLEVQHNLDKYHYNNTSDSVRYIVSAAWDYEYSSRLDLTTGLRLEQEKHNPDSDATNKVGHRISLDFRYSLED